MTTGTSETHAVAPKASLWEDFIDIFASPSEVFERRRDGRYLPALAVLTVLLTVLTYGYFSALSTAFEADFARGAAEAGPEAAQAMETMLAVSRNVAIFGSLVTVPLGVLISGVIILFAAWVFRGRVSLALAITIATYATFPRVLSTLSGILQGILLNPDSLSRVSAGPARFLDPNTASATMVAAAGRIDLFLLWSLVLTAIGLRVLGGMPRRTAYIAAFVVWLIGSLPVAIGAAVSSAVGS